MILANSNIVTVRTSAGDADRLPVNASFGTQVTQRERPDGIVGALGEQLTPDCVAKLEEEGVSDRRGVRALAPPMGAIIMMSGRSDPRRCWNSTQWISA